jgi:hypothetical protein
MVAAGRTKSVAWTASEGKERAWGPAVRSAKVDGSVKTSVLYVFQATGRTNDRRSERVCGEVVVSEMQRVVEKQRNVRAAQME